MKKINYDFNCCVGYSRLKNGSLVEIILETDKTFSEEKEIRKIKEDILINGYSPDICTIINKRVIDNCYYTNFFVIGIFSSGELCLSIHKKRKYTYIRLDSHGGSPDTGILEGIVGILKSRYNLY